MQEKEDDELPTLELATEAESLPPIVSSPLNDSSAALPSLTSENQTIPPTLGTRVLQADLPMDGSNRDSLERDMAPAAEEPPVISKELSSVPNANKIEAEAKQDRPELADHPLDSQSDFHASQDSAIIPPVLDPPVSGSSPADGVTGKTSELTNTKSSVEAPVPQTQKKFPLYYWPFWGLARLWDIASLGVLLAVVAAIPLLQFASLGYLLVASANLAEGKPWRSAFPGLRLAGKLGTFALLTSIAWLPVWLVSDLAYSAQLLQPGSSSAAGWRVAAFVVTGIWLVHLAWAAIRGGRWWHVIWPAPLRFLKHFWRRSTWTKASDQLYDLVMQFRFPQLWWLGARASVGALLWITLPVSLMIIGQRSEIPATGLIGFVGAVAMTIIMLYLPFLQIQLAVQDRFVAIFELSRVRRQFLFSPIAHALALLLLVALCIPLYLLRIEATPEELVWAPALVFVIFMLPAKIFLGAAMGYARNREGNGMAIRHWALRWPSRLVGFVSVLIYVGALYVAQLVAGQGALVMYFQHAFLVPAPLI